MLRRGAPGCGLCVVLTASVCRMADNQLFTHTPHPHTERVLAGISHPPAKVDDGRVGINGRIGLRITAIVGTMVCAYVFAVIALISLPAAIQSHDTTILIAWVSSNFIQLVLLPIIIVGQNLLSKASDKRAEATFKDAEAILHEAIELQKHLAAQDALLMQWSGARTAPSPDPGPGSQDGRLAPG